MPSRTLPVRRPDGSTATLTLTAAHDPAAPVVVVVPAMGMRAGWYPPLAAALLAAGVSTAVTELRGHEATVGARPGRDHDFGYADLAADLGAALDVVRRELPAAPVVLLGHSMGGHVACVHLAGHPDAAAGLVLVTSGTTYWRHWSIWHWSPTNASPWQLVRTQAAVGLSRVVGHFPGARVGFAGREARGVMRDWGRLARRGVLASGTPPRDHGPALATLRLPVLAVSVERDALSPRGAVVGMTRLLPHADVEFVHLAPAAGEPALDHFRWAREPDAVVRPLRAWLRSRIAQTPRGEGFPVVRSSVHERGGGPRNACSTDS